MEGIAMSEKTGTSWPLELGGRPTYRPSNLFRFFELSLQLPLVAFGVTMLCSHRIKVIKELLVVGVGRQTSLQVMLLSAQLPTSIVERQDEVTGRLCAKPRLPP